MIMLTNNKWQVFTLTTNQFKLSYLNMFRTDKTLPLSREKQALNAR